jgi:hypothetical protein
MHFSETDKPRKFQTAFSNWLLRPSSHTQEQRVPRLLLPAADSGKKFPLAFVLIAYPRFWTTVLHI